jgi:branched-subunit amino acid transport protein
MSRTTAWVAVSVCSASLSLMAFALVLIVLGWSTPLPKGWSPWRDQAVTLVGFLGAPVLGTLIASRRPGNLYGWLWLGLGLSFACSQVAEPYAAYALVVQPGSLPAPRTVNTVLASGWALMVTLIPFVLLQFPTGCLPSRRWRFLAWVVLAAGAALLPLGVFSPGEGGFAPVENPLAVGGIVGKAIMTIESPVVMVILGAIILSALSLVVRYRSANGVERQQLKWFALAALLIGGTIVADLLGLDSLLGDALWNLLDAAILASLYVSIGVAILKYRLYDIDLLINRTLVYGSLTAVLAVSYEGGIVALQHVFRLLSAQESQVAVVATTLVIAAMFEPLRRRIQNFVDRRFFRRKYDAAKTLEAFAAKLRDETDLDALSDELAGVVRETMHPAHTSLWLRPDAALKDTKRAAVRRSSYDE